MDNPYRNRPDHSFWRRAIVDRDRDEIDPVVSAPFSIFRRDPVATAGSCFAQHIAKALSRQGYNYLVTEKGPGSPGAIDENYSVFPARFGNVYTVRQLLQLFERAYGLFDPVDVAWRRDDGALVDPFRPRIQLGGFASMEALVVDRHSHLAAVRAMFEGAAVFIFTLGLTESWFSNRDGAVFPLAPGVVASGSAPDDYRFENVRVSAMYDDFALFLKRFKLVNPGIRIILTVSPVPLIATYEDRHVLTSTTASKAALRTLADELAGDFDCIAYFPAYEIVTGSYARSAFFGADLREVTPAGVERVMDLFAKHFLADDAAAPIPTGRSVQDPAGTQISRRDLEKFASLEGIVCDEEALDAEMSL